MEVHTSTTVGYKETVGYCELGFYVIKEKITEIVEEYSYIEGDLSCNYLEKGEFQPHGCSTPFELEPDVDTNDDIFINSCDGLPTADCSFSSEDSLPSCMIVTPNLSFVRYKYLFFNKLKILFYIHIFI